MEIDITDFLKDADAFDFSGSIAERGPNAAKITWENAVSEARRKPLLTTPRQLQALKDHMKEYGAWEPEEIDGWDAEHCNTMFIQLISGDIREAGLDGVDFEDIDWPAYEARAEAGEIGGRLVRGDDGRVWYYLGL